MKIIEPIDAIYLRKSRADLELEAISKLETLARHKKILLELANKRGLNVSHIYEELVSGDSISERPQMQQLLRDVKLNKYRSVIVIEVQRLARGATKDQGEVAEAFKMSNTQIVTPEKTYNPNNEYDEEYFEFGLFMSRREYQTTKRRLHNGLMQCVKEGWYMAATAPFGYDIIKIRKGQRTLIKNEKSELVINIFKWIGEGGLSTREVAKRLTDMNILTSTNKKEWTTESVRDIVKNEIYTGKITWGKRKKQKKFNGETIEKINKRQTDYLIVEGKHEGFIDEVLFNQVQKNIKISSPVKRNKLRNVFAGLVKCNKCKKQMRYLKNRNNIGGRLMHAESRFCTVKSTQYHIIFQEVLHALKQNVNNMKIELTSNKLNDQLETYEFTRYTLENELKKTKLKKEGLFDKVEEGFYTKNEFLERKKILTDKINSICAELDKLQEPTRDELKNKIVTFNEVIDSLTSDKIDAKTKNHLLKKLIKIIYYSHNGTDLILDIHLNE